MIMADMEAQVTENAQPEQVAPVPADAPAPEAFSVDELKSFISAPPEPVKEEVVSDTEQESEQESEVDEQDDQQAVSSADDVVDEKPKAKKQRWEREYEAKVAERARAEAEKARADKAEADAKALKEFIEKAMAAEKPAEIEADDDDVIDTKTAKEVKELKTALVQTKIESAIKEADDLGRKHVPVYDEAKNFVLANLARIAQVNADAVGQTLDDLSAVQAADAYLKAQLANMHSAGKTTGQMAEYVLKQAKVFNYAPQAKAAPEKPKINMKAVDKARETAGAPAIVKETVKFADPHWEQQAAAQLKEKGFSNTLLEKWGLAS
jgi:hypothetical protein